MTSQHPHTLFIASNTSLSWAFSTSLFFSIAEWWRASGRLWSKGFPLFQLGGKRALSQSQPLHLGFHPSAVVAHRQLLQGRGVRSPQGRVRHEHGRLFCWYCSIGFYCNFYIFLPHLMNKDVLWGQWSVESVFFISKLHYND